MNNTIVTEYPIWLVLACILIAFLYAFFLYRRDKTLKDIGKWKIATLSVRFAAVFILYKKKTSMIYHVNRYKCPRCHYKFDEVLTVCPLCEREGYKMDLEAVNQIMT